jgi:hypothetical protein
VLIKIQPRKNTKKETSVKTRFLLSVALILIVCFPGIIIGGCSNQPDGAMPQFTIGDKWMVKWTTGGTEYTVTAEITGDTTVDGTDCWVMETSYNPAYKGQLIGTTGTFDKTNLDILSAVYHTATQVNYTTITFKIEGDPYYPLKVGKKAKEIEHQTISTVTTSGSTAVTQTENVTETTSTVVDKVENITTAAGTFKCFKISKYNENGALTQVTWRSPTVKLYQVKMTDPTDPDSKFELISYSVSQIK